jgi:F0F1-type ATP synthase membrane subunit c/vacuolar-type H+-ATPase subunit K
MDNDKAFFGTILAMMALIAGYPIIALIIFLISVM